jgi:hypothetical protein
MFNGHLSVAQWLFDEGRIDIHDRNDAAFIGSSRFGHVSIAQWLQNVGGIDYSAYNHAFRGTCHNNQLLVAQWLLENRECRFTYQRRRRRSISNCL